MSTVAISRTTRRRWWWFLWALMTVPALGIAGYFVPPYLYGDQNFPVDRTIVGYYASLVFHSVPAGLTLVIGPWQFIPALRRRFPKAHRIAGRLYLASVVAASAAAAYAAAVTPSGFPLQVAFFLLIAVWLYTAARAFLAIRRGQVLLHRIWMIRNYALTFAAVTLRVYQMICLALLPSMSWGTSTPRAHGPPSWATYSSASTSSSIARSKLRCADNGLPRQRPSHDSRWLPDFGARFPARTPKKVIRPAVYISESTCDTLPDTYWPLARHGAHLESK